jgi:hypothetical protein
MPLAFERLGRMGEPGLSLGLETALEGNLNQAGMAAVQAAQQVNRVSEVASGVRTGSLEQ